MKHTCLIYFINTIIIFLLSSCTENNQIYFDEETSCIKSEYGSPISRLTIIYNKEGYSEIFKVENRTDKKYISISLKNIPNDYNITNEQQLNPFVKRRFTILPNCEYEIINHSFGGAAIGIVYIYSVYGLLSFQTSIEPAVQLLYNTY